MGAIFVADRRHAIPLLFFGSAVDVARADSKTKLTKVRQTPDKMAQVHVKKKAKRGP
jgi:hypothetical protein